jgi:GT2 family glycosyltransferase
MNVDAIILSNYRDHEYFLMNRKCIDTLTDAEPDVKFNIVLVESNPEWDSLHYDYQNDNVTVIVPNEKFNFNRFLNIGIRSSSNDLIVLANNDLVFHPGWLTEILRVKRSHPEILSFCPFDRTSKYLKWDDFKSKRFIKGYRVPVEFVGWCFVLHRSVLEITGPLDETFDLYFQDNDFALTLKNKGIPHALVPSSFVEHIGGATTSIPDPSQTEKYRIDKAKLYAKWNLRDSKRPLLSPVHWISLLRSIQRKFRILN